MVTIVEVLSIGIFHLLNIMINENYLNDNIRIDIDFSCVNLLKGHHME